MKDTIETAGSYLIDSRIPFLIFSQDGRVTASNKAAKALFPVLDAAGSPDVDIRTLIVGKPQSEDLVKLEYFLESGTNHFSLEFSPPQTSQDFFQWCRINVDRQSDGNYFAIVQDMTGQKLKETHLVHAKESAERASSSRSQFLANISHEIRTPIQTIIGMMELMSDTRLDEEQTEYARQVRFSADVMLTLINDILDISKVEAGQLKIEKINFDLIDTVERTVDLVSMEAHKKGLEVLIDISDDIPEVHVGDPGRIQQIVLNLVKNAVKFTEKGFIEVSARIIQKSHLSLSEVDSQFLHIEVIDTGIGIPEEARNKLFTQFFQADSSTTRKYGGTGLGLAISRNLVQLMDGEIGVRENPSGGSIFWFDLPLKGAPVQEPKKKLALDPGTRFLLVDDNTQTLEVLSRLLASLGFHNVAQATSGMFALAMLRSAHQAKWPFDIVLIDMIMPEMDGWRLAAEINKNRDINQVQMYLMVPEGGFGADAKMKLLEWFNGYLYKPVKRRRLVELLEEHWQSSIDLEVVDEQEMALRKDSEPELLEPLEEEVSAPAAEGMNILVAEDHPVNSKLLKIFLEKEGAQVFLAEDGEQAIELVQKQQIDMVFMDIQMPRMNGYEAAMWMRSRGYAQPIIACTASAQSDERERCLSIGMTEILPKPYRKKEVGDMIRKIAPEGKTGLAEQAGKEHTMTNGETNAQERFDQAEYMEIMGGDDETARMLIAEYTAQTKSHLEILGEHIRNDDREHIMRTAHLLKGSALNVTARTFASICLELEKTAAECTRDRLDELLRALGDEFSQLTAELTARGYAL